ncbi:MAG: rhodanese-like domain-containing protein [Flavobacteriales bacterium]
MRKVLFLVVAIAAMLFTSCSSSENSFTSPQETFSAEETAKLTKEDVLLIDVRDADEISEQAFDVKNIINIPLDSLESEMNLIPKNKQVILVCRSGKRSGTALDILKEKGYTNIATMEGGMLAWEEAGLPIVKGEDTPKKSCCADPTSANCNPDGTCKTTGEKDDTLNTEASSKKACCSKETKDSK